MTDAAGFVRYLAVWNGEAPVAGLALILAPGYRGHLGSQERDALVFAKARLRGLPVAVAFAGGYARKVEDTVRIHVNTVRAAREAAAARAGWANP